MNILNKTVFLVDDCDRLRLDLCNALEFAGYRARPFSDPDQFLANFQYICPAALVTDMSFPNSTGVQLQLKMRHQGYRLPTIFISGESSDAEIVSAFKDGAVDFLLKPFGLDIFLGAVAKAIESDTVKMLSEIRRNQLLETLKILSPRELQVFHLLSKGCNNGEIVSSLGVSLHTAKQYKSEVMLKLRLRSLSELIALSANLISLGGSDTF